MKHSDYLPSLKRNLTKIFNDYIVLLSDAERHELEISSNDPPSAKYVVEIITKIAKYFWDNDVRFQAKEIIHQMIPILVDFINFFNKRLELRGWEDNGISQLYLHFLEMLDWFTGNFTSDEIEDDLFANVVEQFLITCDIYNPTISFGLFKNSNTEVLQVPNSFLRLLPMKKKFALAAFEALSGFQIDYSVVNISSIPQINYVEVFSDYKSPYEYSKEFVSGSKTVWTMPDVIMREFSIETLQCDSEQPKLAILKQINHNYLSIKCPTKYYRGPELVSYNLNFLMKFGALPVVDKPKCGSLYAMNDGVTGKTSGYRVLLLGSNDGEFIMYKVDTGEFCRRINPILYQLPPNVVRSPYGVKLAQLTGVSPYPNVELIIRIIKSLHTALYKGLIRPEHIVANRGCFIFNALLHFEHESLSSYAANILHKLSESKVFAVSDLGGLEMDLFELLKSWTDSEGVLLLRKIIPILQNLQYHSPAIASILIKRGLYLELLRALHVHKCLSPLVWSCLRAPLHSYIIFQQKNVDKETQASVTPGTMPWKVIWTKKLTISYPNKVVYKQHTIVSKVAGLDYTIVPFKDFVPVNIAQIVCGMLNSQKGGNIVCGVVEVHGHLVVKGLCLNMLELNSLDAMLQELPSYFTPSFPNTHVRVMFEKVETNLQSRNSLRECYVLKCLILPDVGECVAVQVKGEVTAYIREGRNNVIMSAQKVRELVISLEEEKVIRKYYLKCQMQKTNED